jgi:hypothetical protein
VRARDDVPLARARRGREVAPHQRLEYLGHHRSTQ